MMKRIEAGRCVLIALALVALTAPGFAQEKTSQIPATTQSDIGAPESWGTASTTTVALSAYDFQAFHQTGAVTGLNDDGNGFTWATGGANKLFIAGVPVPSGAEIERVGLWYCDTAVGTAGQFLLVAYQINANGSFTTITSFATPDQACGVAINGADLNYLFNSNSGSNIQFYLFQSGAAVAGEVKFRGADLRYRLRVSPAPGTATFPNDVPTTHPFFRFVEAMAASGLTGGCGTGAFCPDQAVTRGQMSVFLATALGLHFPN